MCTGPGCAQIYLALTGLEQLRILLKQKSSRLRRRRFRQKSGPSERGRGGEGGRLATILGTPVEVTKPRAGVAKKKTRRGARGRGHLDRREARRLSAARLTKAGLPVVVPLWAAGSYAEGTVATSVDVQEPALSERSLLPFSHWVAGVPVLQGDQSYARETRYKYKGQERIRTWLLPPPGHGYVWRTAEEKGVLKCEKLQEKLPVPRIEAVPVQTDTDAVDILCRTSLTTAEMRWVDNQLVKGNKNFSDRRTGLRYLRSKQWDKMSPAQRTAWWKRQDGL